MKSTRSTKEIHYLMISKYKHLNRSIAFDQAVQMISHQKQIQTSPQIDVAFWTRLFKKTDITKEVDTNTMEFIIDIIMASNIADATLSTFQCIQKVYLKQTKSKYLDSDHLLFAIIDYYYSEDPNKFFKLIDDHLSDQYVVTMSESVTLELLSLYRIGVNHYKQLLDIPSFTRNVFESILFTDDVLFFVHGQQFVMMAVIIQCLYNNQDLAFWFQRLNDMNTKITSAFSGRHLRELKENQQEIYMAISILQNVSLSSLNCPFSLYVEKLIIAKTEFINLRIFRGEHHKLRVLWFLFHEMHRKKWATLDEWFKFSCDELMKDFLVQFMSLLNVPTHTVSKGGQYAQIWIDQKIFKQCIKELQYDDVFNFIIVIKYTVGNWFDGKTLIANYLMEQAINPRSDWKQFAKSMRIFEAVYKEECVHYFEIYEVALRYHDKSFLFPVMCYRFHQLFLETNDSKLFIVGQRYFMKGIIEMITSSESSEDNEQFMEWFDAMSDDPRMHMFECCEEAQQNRYRMHVLSKIFNESTNC